MTTSIFAFAKLNQAFRLDVSSLPCGGCNAVIVLVLLGPLQYLSRGKHREEYRTDHVKLGSDESTMYVPLGLLLLQVIINAISN